MGHPGGLYCCSLQRIDSDFLSSFFWPLAYLHLPDGRRGLDLDLHLDLAKHQGGLWHGSDLDSMNSIKMVNSPDFGLLVMAEEMRYHFEVASQRSYSCGSGSLRFAGFSLPHSGLQSYCF